MRRSAYHQLKEWKASVKRKPLIVQGARQVGKTYLISEFGKKEYSNFVYLNFERDKSLESLFEKSLDPDIIINNISLYIGEKIVAEDTLLFFDEIQTVPAVLTSLKYFYEQVPDYHLIAAGSLLGGKCGKREKLSGGES